MSKYKLVPVEPTIEMAFAGIEVYGIEECADADVHSVWEAMLAAAPEVEPAHRSEQPAPDAPGEPVAYAVFADSGNIRIWCADPIQTEILRLEYGDRVRPLYTAPQPSFQLPDFATDPDDSDEGASLWDHGFKRGWNACLEAATKTMQPAEQPECGCCGQTVTCDDDCDAVVIGGNGAAKQKPVLTEAPRQYRNNDGSGLVFGYDKLLVDWYVAGLVQQHHRDSAALRRLCQARDEQRDGRLAALERAAKAEGGVAQLVDALERCMTSMLDAGFNTRSAVIAQGWQALAAHRKQGSEQ